MTYSYSTSGGYSVEFKKSTKVEVMLAGGSVKIFNCIQYEVNDGYLALYYDDGLLSCLFNSNGWLFIREAA